MELQDELLDFFESGQDWESLETDVPGLRIVKVPKKNKKTQNTTHTLKVEVNPLVGGRPMKFKGLFLSNRDIYLKFYEILSEPKLNTILVALEKVNERKSEKKILSIG